MGRKVLITYRVMPESVETDIDAVVEDIKGKINNVGEIKDVKLEPIAFGLKSIKVLVMIEDKEGVVDAIENMIKEVKGVESVETESLTLI